MAESKYKLKIEAAVEGQEQIRSLANEVRELGSEAGSKAAPQARKLAEELERLGQEQAAIRQFRALSEATEEAAQEQAELQRSSADLKPALDNVNNTVRNLTRSYRENEQELGELTDRHAAEKAAIASLRDTVRQAAADKAALRDRTRELKQAIKEAGDPAGELKRELGSIAEETSRLTDKQKTSREEIRRLGEETKKTGAEKKALSAHLREVGRSQKAAEKNAKALGKEYGAARRKTRQLSEVQREQRQALAGAAKEMDRLGVSAENLARTEKGLAANIRGATRDIDTFKKGLKSARAQAAAPIPDNTKRFRSGMERATEIAGRFGSVIKGFVLVQLGRMFVSANKDAETLSRGLELVTGSATAAAEEMDFVRRTANRLGVDVEAAGRAYLNLAAAAKGTALEGEQARKIFTSVSQAMSRLGKSSADTEGALKAIEQIISKGKVSAEELRGQLGERLPGAFQAAARAVGVTTAELDDMLKSGKLVAEDLLPNLAEELDKTFGGADKVESFTASWNRFINAVKGAAVDVEKSTGGMEKLSGAVDTATKSVRFLSAAYRFLSGKIKEAASDLGGFNKQLDEPGLFERYRRLGESAFSALKQNIVDTALSVVGLNEDFEKVGKTGKAAGEEIKEGMEKAGEAIRAATKRPTESQQNSVFEWMMTELRTLTDEGIPGFVTRLGEMREAHLLTDGQVGALRITLVELQKQVGATADETVAATRKTSDANAEWLEQYRERIRVEKESQEEALRAKERNTRASEDAAEAQETQNRAVGSFVNLTAIVRQNYYDISEAAGEYFDRAMAGVRTIKQWWTVLSDREFNRVKAHYEDMHRSVDAFIDRIRSGTASAARMALATKHGAATAKELGEERLATLRQALADATARTERMADAAENALRKYQDLIDRQKGNELAIAERERADALRELEEQLQDARKAGNRESIQDLERAMALARRYHDEEMAALRRQIEGEREITQERERRADLPQSPPPNRTLPASPVASPAAPAAPPTAQPPNNVLPVTYQPPDPETLRRLEEIRDAIGAGNQLKTASPSRVIELRPESGAPITVGFSDEENSSRFLEWLETQRLVSL